MNINLTISPATTITQNIVVAIFKASAPNIVVDHQEFTPPHLSPRNITFPDVEPESYLVNTYETPGWPTLGILRHSFMYDPTFVGVEYRVTEELVMDASNPKLNGPRTIYTDPAWAGWVIESVERVGVGTQYHNADYVEGSGGTQIILSKAGDTFQVDEKWVVRWYPKITVTNPVFRSAKIVRDSLIVDANLTLDEDDGGIALLCRSSTDTLELTLPAIGTIEAFLMYVFIADGGNQRNTVITCTGTDRIQWNGAQVDHIIIGQQEQLFLVNDPVNGWLVIKDSKGMHEVGEIVTHYARQDADLINCLFADGRELDRTVERRLWERVLDLGTYVTDAVWNSSDDNKAKYSTGDGVNTFRLPRLYIAGFARAVDGTTRIAGSFQAAGIDDITLNVTVPAVNTSKTDVGVGRIATGSEDTEPTDLSFPMEITGDGDGTRPDNFGVYALIRT